MLKKILSNATFLSIPPLKLQVWAKLGCDGAPKWRNWSPVKNHTRRSVKQRYPLPLHLLSFISSSPFLAPSPLTLRRFSVSASKISPSSNIASMRRRGKLCEA